MSEKVKKNYVLERKTSFSETRNMLPKTEEKKIQIKKLFSAVRGLWVNSLDTFDLEFAEQTLPIELQLCPVGSNSRQWMVCHCTSYNRCHIKDQAQFFGNLHVILY